MINIYFPNYANGSSNTVISGRAINSVIISVLILLAVVEMRRALGTERIPDCFSWLLWLYGIGLGPAYSLFGYIGILFFTLLVFIAAAITSLVKRQSRQSFVRRVYVGVSGVAYGYDAVSKPFCVNAQYFRG